MHYVGIDHHRQYFNLLGTYICSRTIDFKEPQPAAKPAPKK
jgi:hypothetical protein